MPNNIKHQAPKTIKFHYKKNSDFKTYLATGVYGGITSSLMIDANFYIERPPIPKVVEHQVEGDKIGKEIDKDSLDGAVREVNVGLVIDINMARALRQWLDDKINKIEEYEKTHNLENPKNV